MIDTHSPLYPQPRPDPSNGSLTSEDLPAVFAIVYLLR